MYIISLLVLFFITCLSFLLIFGLSGWRCFVFLTFNTALSVVINRSSRSSGDDLLFEILIRSFAYEDINGMENEVGSCFNTMDDEGCKSASHDINDDDECEGAPNDVEELVEGDQDSFTQRVDDELARRSEEFIKRGRQRWREEMDRDRDQMKNK